MPDSYEQFPAGQGGIKVPKVVDLKNSIGNPALRRIVAAFERPIERTLSLDALNKVNERAVLAGGGRNFHQACLDAMRIHYAVSREDMQKIPADGPLVVVSNHPFGCLEGVILGALMNEVRPDARALGNYFLRNIHSLREWVIPVDPFGGDSAAASNLKGMKQAIKWVKGGGALITFPAGEVSRFQWRQCKVTDSPWSRHIAAIIQLSRASVLPVYFPGANSLLFHLLGMIHPRLRTALLPREVINKCGRTIDLFIGKPISSNKLASCGEYEEMVNYLRDSAYFLRNRVQEKKKPGTPSLTPGRFKARKEEPIIPETARHIMTSEVKALPESCRMVEIGDYSVYVTGADLIPNVLREIGRLRELTFREVREGTGKPLDLDRFDQYYLHLFLWNKTHEELAGAYRLGLMDVVLREHGKSGLYTSTLFRFKRGLLDELGNAIEVGRSFIRSEYQKEYSCLSLLWRGIGEFITRNPRYNMLFGPVSISNDYHAVSKRLMVQFLRLYKSDSDLSRFVRPRKPYRKGKPFGRQSIPSFVRDIDDVSLLISEIEKNGRGIPILLRHYLKLNATILSFNVDKHFSNVVDGLILVDLTQTDRKLLKRFMGKEGLEIFTKHNELTPDPDIARLAQLAAGAASDQAPRGEER